MFRQSGRRQSNFRSQGNSFRPRSGRVPKTIDPRLFVKKATIQQEVAYVPEHSFADFPFSEPLKLAISKRGYVHPTPIQDRAIPVLLEGRDVVGLASTGTGKTAAFLLPIIHHLLTDPTNRALIIAPTRELAVQIQDEFYEFAIGMRLLATLCIGGMNMFHQIQQIRRVPHVIIGTPGRLKDLEKQRVLSFAGFKTIVLDEVDRMLDMGFINDVTYITSRLPETRQSLFFSATMPDEARGIMQQFLTNPEIISVAKSSPSANVDQDIVKLNGRSKIDVLDELLRTEGFDKVLVFGRTKYGMDKLQRALQTKGVSVAAIHGNKRQSQRQRAIDDFKQNRIQVLLATDIASRGLDIDQVTHVINFDQPESYEDYIHRIGRTGRANNTGIALTFVD